MSKRMISFYLRNLTMTILFSEYYSDRNFLINKYY